jgi:carbon storage regulator CsrA
MLVLSRRVHDQLVLPELGVTVEVVAVHPGVVRLGIQAPPDVQVLRQELLERLQEPAPAANA